MASDIRPGITDAFITHHGELRDAAYEMWPSLTFAGATIIMDSLAGNLWCYRRPAGPGFVLWAKAWVRREATRHRFLTELFTKNDNLIFAAIERSIYKSVEDLAVEPMDYKAEIFLHLLQNPEKLKGLMNPKEAKVSTMLYKLVRTRMWGAQTQLSDRRTLASRWLQDFELHGVAVADPPEHLDPYEKKMMRYELSGVR